MPAPCLTVSAVSYAVRGHVLLEDLSFASAPEVCTALLGANGSGKTTLLRLCHGLIEPQAGSVRWGQARPDELGRRIAMVFQKPCLLRRSARANVDYVLRLHGLSRGERRRRGEQLLSLVGLERYAERQALSLSGGEQQRLAVARACALNPEVILMDEPTARLDVESTAMVEDVIAGLKREGVKVILVSHNVPQVRRLCDEVIFLDRGRLIERGSCDEFFNNPRSPTVCDFIRLQTSC